MLFHRGDFFVFFIVVAGVYFLLRHRYQNYWLLAASYFFYGCWDWRFTGLLLLSTCVDFLAGHKISLAQERHQARSWLGLSICVNLGILATFKYFNFFADSATRLLAHLGFEASLPTLYVILPVGISFYTFQSMSYTVDIYRGKTESVTRSSERLLDAFSSFALYVSFFPQLVAGPIERSTRLLPQILGPRLFSASDVTHGIWLFTLGLALKVGIADEIATQVDYVYADLTRQTAASIYRGTLGFAIQIYCDFAGYSLMARGVARSLGFDLMVNFRQPYLASSFSDFWRRWHISLSTWIRDYLYIPLGGSRRGAAKNVAVLVATMGIAGLWHGTTWAFVGWGVLHAGFLMIERFRLWRVLGGIAFRLPGIAHLWCLIYGLLVLHGVLLAWVLFRIGNIDQLLVLFDVLLDSGIQLGQVTELPVRLPTSAPFAKFLLIIVLVEIPSRVLDRELFPRDYPGVLRAVLYLAIALILLSSSGNADAPFIYFQF